MSNLKIAFSIIFSLIITLSFTACKQKYAVELAAIDSLVVKNKTTMDDLNIDLITINNRKEIIKKQLDSLEGFTPDSSELEYTMNLDKYKGIHKVYTKFIDNYDVIFNRIRLNDSQLSSLKNSILDEKISGSDFKLALEKERLHVHDNQINAQTVGRRVMQLEPDYQRLSAYFEKLLKKK